MLPSSWCNGVVPVGAYLMVLEMQLPHFSWRYFHPPLVRPLPPFGGYLQPGFARCAAQESQQYCRRLQRHSGPVGTDRPKQTVLHWIPLRRSRGIVAHRHHQAITICQQFLQALLPQSGSVTVTAARVGQQQQGPNVAVAMTTDPRPPAGNRFVTAGLFGDDLSVAETVP